MRGLVSRGSHFSTPPLLTQQRPGPPRTWPHHSPPAPTAATTPRWAMNTSTRVGAELVFAAYLEAAVAVSPDLALQVVQ